MDRIVPVHSLSFRDCIENCSDYAWVGVKYNTGNGIIMIGVADLINSMAAIRHLVYEEKSVTMEQMVKPAFQTAAGVHIRHLNIPRSRLVCRPKPGLQKAEMAGKK